MFGIIGQTDPLRRTEIDPRSGGKLKVLIGVLNQEHVGRFWM